MKLVTMALAAHVLLAAGAAQQPQPASRGMDPEILKLQVALDRAGFSSGVIDGRAGVNTTRALDAYKKQHGRDPDLSAAPLVEYRITPEDTAGPFVSDLPADLIQQSKLTALGYRGVESTFTR